MPSLTLQSVEKAAPDAASLTAARRLAKPGPWSDLGSTESLVWGKCQGSGRTPYQVSIDLNGPAYRCSCPSRKFPCKHALALMLLWVQGNGSVAMAESPPDFATTWAESRAQRAADAAAPKKSVDPQARQRRIAERRALMTAGLEEFERWLTDLVRGGLAQAGQQPVSWWDRTAARLVDAQLPGLAERVRRMSYTEARGESGARLLLELGRWWLAVRAWRCFDDLDEATRGDLRVVLGWNQASEDVRDADKITDDWEVLGAHRSDDGTITQQRTWLHGSTTGEVVQILDFGAQGRPLPMARLAGSVLQATLSRYPGHRPQRALFTEEPLTLDRHAVLDRSCTISAACEQLIRGWSENPWLERVPVALDGVVRPLGDLNPRKSRPDAAQACLRDSAGKTILLHGDPIGLLALSGGRPITVFGELDQDRFRPLSVDLDGELVTP